MDKGEKTDLDFVLYDFLSVGQLPLLVKLHATGHRKFRGLALIASYALLPSKDEQLLFQFCQLWSVVQALVKELQSGKLPLVRATGPFGCSGGHKWGGHQVMVIFAGGIGVGAPLTMMLPSTPVFPPSLHPVPGFSCSFCIMQHQIEQSNCLCICLQSESPAFTAHRFSKKGCDVQCQSQERRGTTLP